jgi:hypothetical protein
MRLAHDSRELPAQIGDDRAIDLEFRRQRGDLRIEIGGRRPEASYWMPSL